MEEDENKLLLIHDTNPNTKIVSVSLISLDNTNLDNDSELNHNEQKKNLLIYY